MSDLEMKLKKALIKTMLDSGESISDIAKATSISIKSLKEMLPEFGYYTIAQVTRELGMVRVRRSKKGIPEAIHHALYNFWNNNLGDMHKCRYCPNRIRDVEYINKKCLTHILKVYDYRRLRPVAEGHRRLSKAAKDLNMVTRAKSGNYIGSSSIFLQFYENHEEEIRLLNPDCPKTEGLRISGQISDSCFRTVKKIHNKYKLKRKRNPVERTSLLTVATMGISAYLAYRLFKSWRC